MGETAPSMRYAKVPIRSVFIGHASARDDFAVARRPVASDHDQADEERAMANEGDDIPVYKGSCLCGEIQYQVVGRPDAVSLCHCKDCQKNTGSAFSLNAIFPKGALTIVSGSPAEYLGHGDAATVVRTFCRTCGTPIESRSIYSKDGYAVIKAGTFDDPGAFPPDSEVYCKSALSWVTPDPARRCFDGLGSI